MLRAKTASPQTGSSFGVRSAEETVWGFFYILQPSFVSCLGDAAGYATCFPVICQLVLLDLSHRSVPQQNKARC